MRSKFNSEQIPLPILNQAIEFEGESAKAYPNVGAQRRDLINSVASFKSVEDGILWWRGQDLNLRTLTRADLQSAAIDHSATSPQMNGFENKIGAGEGNRTLTASLEGWNSTVELHPLKIKTQFYLKDKAF